MDDGWGLTNDGTLTHPRAPSDLKILSNPLLAGNRWSNCGAPQGDDVREQPGWVHCHRGGQVAPIAECGGCAELGSGSGGTLLPGVYILREYGAFGAGTSPSPGVPIAQTLYVTESSLLLASDDSNNFAFTGTYTFVAAKNNIRFTALCESGSPQYRAFPAEATFTATPTTLELFDEARLVREKYVKIE